jgi:TolA-binding protein
VLLLAGQVAAGLGGAHDGMAIDLFAQVVRTGGDGAAPPAAELEWARVLARQGNVAEAIEHLERLILTYPSSAVVPEARRELERARGAIPRS